MPLGGCDSRAGPGGLLTVPSGVEAVPLSPSTHHRCCMQTKGAPPAPPSVEVALGLQFVDQHQAGGECTIFPRASALDEGGGIDRLRDKAALVVALISSRELLKYVVSVLATPDGVQR